MSLLRSTNLAQQFTTDCVIANTTKTASSHLHVCSIFIMR